MRRALRCRVLPCHSMRFHLVPCGGLPGHAALSRSTMPWCAIPCHALPALLDSMWAVMPGRRTHWVVKRAVFWLRCRGLGRNSASHVGVTDPAIGVAALDANSWLRRDASLNAACSATWETGAASASSVRHSAFQLTSAACRRPWSIRRGLLSF